MKKQEWIDELVRQGAKAEVLSRCSTATAILRVWGREVRVARSRARGEVGRFVVMGLGVRVLYDAPGPALRCALGRLRTELTNARRALDVQIESLGRACEHVPAPVKPSQVGADAVAADFDSSPDSLPPRPDPLPKRRQLVRELDAELRGLESIGTELDHRDLSREGAASAVGRALSDTIDRVGSIVRKLCATIDEMR